MTHQGIRALFDRSLAIDEQRSVLPIWSLTWIVKSWADGLTAQVRDKFLNLPLGALLEPPQTLLAHDWVKQLPEEKNFELASATILLAHKPTAGDSET